MTACSGITSFIRMAYSQPNKKWACGLCGEKYTDNKLWESHYSPAYNAGLVNLDAPDVEETRKLRSCAKCELRERRKVPTDKHPIKDYCTEEEVTRSMKAQNKGDAWTAHGMHYRYEYAQVALMEGHMTRDERARHKTRIAAEQAASFLKVIRGGALYHAFSAAGKSIKGNAKISEEFHLPQ